MTIAALALSAWLAGACAGRAQSLSPGTAWTAAPGCRRIARRGRCYLEPCGRGTGGEHRGRPRLRAPEQAPPGAGAPGAGAAGAPAPAAGAGGESDVCDNIDCPDIVCAKGSEPVVPPGACCATCQCTQVCAACPIDTRPEMQAGQCCPVCVPNNPPISCEVGKMLYATSRAQLVEKYSQGCSADSQCVTITVANACESCQPVALSSSAAIEFLQQHEFSAARQTELCRGLPAGTGLFRPALRRRRRSASTMSASYRVECA